MRAKERKAIRKRICRVLETRSDADACGFSERQRRIERRIDGLPAIAILPRAVAIPRSTPV